MAGEVIQLLSLARRAGRIVAGDTAVRSAIQRRKASLVVLAADAAQRTRRSFLLLTQSAGIPVITFGSREELGRVLNRSICAVAAITDKNLSRGILETMEKGG